MHRVCVAVFCVCIVLYPLAVLTSIKCSPGPELAQVAVHEFSSVMLDCQCESSEGRKWEYCNSSPVFEDLRKTDKTRWAGFTLLNNYSLRIWDVKHQFEGSYVCWCNHSNKTQYYLKIQVKLGLCLCFLLGCITLLISVKRR